MEIFRLIKPIWGKSVINNIPNPEFKKEIVGPNVIEGQLSQEFIREKNEEGYNIYYFPNNCASYIKGQILSGRNIDNFRYVFVDFDLKTKAYKSKEEFVEVLNSLKIQPTLILDSGNGIHAYWRISNLSKELYVETQLRLIKLLKTDDSVWTVLQLMRYPGTINTKDFDQQKRTIILSQNDNSYPIESLLEILPELDEQEKNKKIAHLNKLLGIESSIVLNDVSDDLPPKFKKILEQNKDIYDLFYNPRVVWDNDRSKADLSLCNRLFILNFDRTEALQIILQTEKSKSRSPENRVAYAKSIIDKVYNVRPKKVAKSLSELEQIENLFDLGDPVKGPSYFDCLENPWRQKQVLGLIAGTGIGKTSISLNIIKESIDNNMDKDFIYLYFSLEMSAGEIITRWNKLTNNSPLYKDKLFIITNENEDDDSIRHLGLQDIYEYSLDTVKKLGKKIAIMVIDHVDAINPIIDLRKTNTMGFSSEMTWQTKVKIELKDICAKLKELAKDLNCFLIIQSQTTKVKSGNGDVALGVDAAFGTARFEWFCDFVMTCWQPLMKIYHLTPLRALAWKYAKIRETHENDKVQRGSSQLLKYNMLTGNLRPMEETEYYETLELLKQVHELKKEEVKQKIENINYKNSPNITKLRLILKNESNK